MKKLARLAFVWAVAASGLVACRGDLTNPGIELPGHFFAQMQGHKDTSATGDALFYETVEDGAEVLTLFLTTPGSKFQMSFKIRDYDRQTGQHEIGLNPDRYPGEYSYTANGQRVRYDIVGGTFSLSSITQREIKGEFNFQATAIDGLEPGAAAQIQGTFTAACDGDCLAGGGPPPGS